MYHKKKTGAQIIFMAWTRTLNKEADTSSSFYIWQVAKYSDDSIVMMMMMQPFIRHWYRYSRLSNQVSNFFKREKIEQS